MRRRIELLKLKEKIDEVLCQYGCLMLKDDWLEDDVEELVQKTLDKFENDCYNILRKKRKER